MFEVFITATRELRVKGTAPPSAKSHTTSLPVFSLTESETTRLYGAWEKSNLRCTDESRSDSSAVSDSSVSSTGKNMIHDLINEVCHRDRCFAILERTKQVLWDMKVYEARRTASQFEAI